MDQPSIKRWHTREDSGLVLDRHGRWWHDGEPIEHPKILEAFNRGLTPTSDGRFKLEVGRDWCFVQVEDAAYRVLTVDSDPVGVVIGLSDRTQEQLDPMTLKLDEENMLSCRVKNGLAKARFSRDAQFALGNLLEPEGSHLSLRVGDRRIPVPLPSEST